MTSKHTILLLFSLLGMAWPAGADTPAAPPRVSNLAINNAIDQAAKYVLAQLTETGSCKLEYPKTDPRFGKRTLLSIYALLSARLDPQRTPKLQAAIQWAQKAELTGVGPHAYRALAMSLLKTPESKKTLQADAAWLTKAADNQGAYTHTSSGGGESETYDNTNSIMALLAVNAARRQGVDVPPPYWKLMEQHWLGDQQSDGGWGYRVVRRKNGDHCNTYGSMTAAGLTALIICNDQITRNAIIHCKRSSRHQSTDKAMEWLEKRFNSAGNPKKGVEWYYEWLFLLQQAGTLTGRKTIGGHEWFPEIAAQLLRKQHDDGSWSFGDRLYQTCMGLIFLSQGQGELLVSKLRFAGRWDTRPRDVANMARYLSNAYERGLGWQITELKQDDGWQNGRIVYISGAGPIQLSNKAIEKLRRFVYRGGLIISESACNNGDFTLDMNRLYQRLFPEFRLKQLPQDSPAYNLQYENTLPAGLMGVSNGVRLLAIHSPRDLSLGLELGEKESQRPYFNLVANLYLYLTARNANASVSLPPWPKVSSASLQKNARLARIKIPAMPMPEPLALPRLAAEMAIHQKVKLKLSEPTPPKKLDARRWPVAYLAGAENFTLSSAQQAALVKYVNNGGTIIINAAGGSSTFGRAVKMQILDLFEKTFLLPMNSDLYLGGPYRIDKVQYRRGTTDAFITKESRNQPHLQAVYVQGRPAIIFSGEDITAGLLNYPLAKLHGYSPEDARKLMTNLIMQLNGLIKPTPAATQPASAPTTAPAAIQSHD